MEIAEVEQRDIASGLAFPEGPVACRDGSILLVEIARGTLVRVGSDGAVDVVAECGGGPNGVAIGPDGAAYVCNNGGFEWHERMGVLVPGNQPSDWSGGRIERVDIETGSVDILYAECDAHPLRGPNDIVFDGAGGFWFTDHGKTRARDRDLGGLYWARVDGSEIREVVYPLDRPNGVGLAPGGRRVYVAETGTCRLFAWNVTEPGVVEVLMPDQPTLGAFVAAGSGRAMFDSLAVEADGTVAVATLVEGGITRIAADGSDLEHVPFADPLVTNICFGAPGTPAETTAYITLSGTGRLVAADWPRGGAPLAHVI
ncbi:MAG: SMP-30/gluconolactonase/LRE family protein [Acidimicrobiia bacterium]|nr:SMP-30/gluconolactonase/LRE family protein [Acidimicrobiia bacterium]